MRRYNLVRSDLIREFEARGVKVAHLEREVEELAGRGLHSSTFQLNLSALYGIGGARRSCVARAKGVLGDA